MRKKTIVAFIYDFDKTLSTTDMQNYSFIPSLNYEISDFWEKSNQLSQKEHMDPLLSYMYLMVKECEKLGKPLTRKFLMEKGKDIKYFPGVRNWFARVTEYGKSKGVTVQHYIISSGNKEIIQGTEIYPYFKKVFACEYLYDASGKAIWPKTVINYTTKTQFIYRINKGVLDVAENEKVNASMPDSLKPVPFENMVYIADGLTDVPCMKLVRGNGGTAIAVYNSDRGPARDLFEKGRVDFICPADYNENSALDHIAKLLIDKIAPMDQLYRLHIKQMHKKSKKHA